jgi:hypothetical protein
MAVPMVQVRIVWMSMHHRRMPVYVDMRLAGRVIRSVIMVVMLVMHMGMPVQHLLMRMLMLVVLDKMQPQAHAHQHGGGNQPDSEGLPPRRCPWWRGPLR